MGKREVCLVCRSHYRGEREMEGAVNVRNRDFEMSF